VARKANPASATIAQLLNAIVDANIRGWR
jgi:hypothetical protein